MHQVGNLWAILFFVATLHSTAFAKLKCTVTGSQLSQDTIIYLRNRGLVVVHASSTYYPSEGVKAAMDEIIEFHESMNTDTHALVHDGGKTWVTKQKEFSTVIQTDAGRHRMHAPPNERVGIIGGYFNGCLKCSVDSFLANRDPVDTHFDLPLPAIYGVYHFGNQPPVEGAMPLLKQNLEKTIDADLKLIKQGFYKFYRRYEVYVDGEPDTQACKSLETTLLARAQEKNIDLEKLSQFVRVRVHLWTTNQKYKDSFKPKEWVQKTEFTFCVC